MQICWRICDDISFTDKGAIMQVMQRLIDLEALQPTGDLSSVQTIQIEYKSTIIVYCISFFKFFYLGEEIHSIFLGQSVEPVTRPAADSGCNWWGMQTFNLANSKNLGLITYRIIFYKLKLGCLTGFIRNSSRSTFSIPLHLYFCLEGIFYPWRLIPFSYALAIEPSCLPGIKQN